METIDKFTKDEILIVEKKLNNQKKNYYHLLESLSMKERATLSTMEIWYSHQRVTNEIEHKIKEINEKLKKLKISVEELADEEKTNNKKNKRETLIKS